MNGAPIHPKRAKGDFYPTPFEATRALLSVERFDGSIWEPACGDGAMSKVLTKAGHFVISTDLIDRGYGDGGVDFLSETAPRAKHIITNPPFGRGTADLFIRRALQLTRGTGGSVAMLLDLASLCHPLRHDKFIRTPPAAIYGFDQLVFYPDGIFNAAILRTASQRFCWVVWRPGHKGRPTFWWLSSDDFRDPADTPCGRGG